MCVSLMLTKNGECCIGLASFWRSLLMLDTMSLKGMLELCKPYCVHVVECYSVSFVQDYFFIFLAVGLSNFCASVFSTHFIVWFSRINVVVGVHDDFSATFIGWCYDYFSILRQVSSVSKYIPNSVVFLLLARVAVIILCVEVCVVKTIVFIYDS